MPCSDLVNHLLALPDRAARRQFLKDHISLVDDQFISDLKECADQFLRSDLHRSLQIVNLIHDAAELTGNPLHRAKGLRAEANAASIGQRQYQQGLELYNEAVEIYRAQGCLVDQAISQIGKIGALLYLGRYEEALASGNWANGILAAHAEHGWQAVLIMNMAAVYDRLGELAQALEMVDQAGQLYIQLGTNGEAGLGLAQITRAVILRNLGRFEESIQASQAAREILTRRSQLVEAARAQQSLALTYFVLGRYNEALDNLNQVRDIFLSDGRQPDAMLVELFTSDCLLQLRRFTDVLEKCHQVRSLFAEVGAHHVVAQAIVNEAVAYTELGRYAEALDSLAEARPLFQRDGNHVWVASTDLETAAVLLRQSKYDDSRTTALACADVFKAHDLAVEEAQARLVAARAALALGLDAQALHLTAAVLKVGEARHVPILTYQARHLLGSLAVAHGYAYEAFDNYDRAIQELERLRGRLMVEFRVGFLEDKSVIYEDAVELCLETNRPLRGLEYAERAKSRALLDLLAQRLDLSVQARAETDRPLVTELLRLRAERDRLYRRWESDGDSGERGWTTSDSDRQRAQQNVLALEKQITALWHRLLIHNADYARDAALWQVRTEPIQPYLPPGCLLIEYFVVHHQLVVFLVTRKSVHCVRLPGELVQVQQLIQWLWLNLKIVPRSSPSQLVDLENKACELLQRLYDLVIRPLGDELSKYDRLIIVPHGPLHYLPFHALHDGQAYLLERHEISYLPNASFLRYCREASLASSGVVAIGHSNEGRLPHAVREAHTIAALMGGQALLEDRATLAHIQQAVLNCRVVHLATHGDFRPDNPLFSGLALTDGWLTTLDIFGLRLKASLVTLSACQTGRSVVGGGDELLGLMRAFLSAGAASLALSLWAVEDCSTARLMETFYGKMIEGRTKGAALRDAQLQFIAGRTKGGDVQAVNYTHPYFWAPFFLVGDTGPL